MTRHADHGGGAGGGDQPGARAEDQLRAGHALGGTQAAAGLLLEALLRLRLEGEGLDGADAGERFLHGGYHGALAFVIFA